VDEYGFPQVHDRLLGYFRRCITGEDHPFALPDIPVYLNEVLAAEDFCGGIEPRIGRKYIRVLALDGFPKVSSPGILGEIDALPMEYRWSTRAILLDPEEARGILDHTRKKWRSRIRLKPGFLMHMGATKCTQQMAEDANRRWGYCVRDFTCRILQQHHLHDDDGCHENTRLVIEGFEPGFSCRLESINAVSLARQPPRKMVRNCICCSTRSTWLIHPSHPSGLARRSFRMPKNSPPLLFAATTGATPFRVNLHVADLGHTLMCGPSGAGKSTALGLIAAQWFRYPRAQVFAFDKGYSLFVLTKAAGGEFYDLAGERTHLAFCPLRVRLIPTRILPGP
jgi:type IV secretion system protein VirB4